MILLPVVANVHMHNLEILLQNGRNVRLVKCLVENVTVVAPVRTEYQDDSLVILLRNSQGSVSKLEEKLSKQLSGAKWTVGQIRQIRPDWDEMGFYHSVQAKQPTPRGRRPRSEATA